MNLEIVKKYYEPKTILDIGANVGQFYNECKSIFTDSYYYLVEGNLKDSCYFYYAYDSDGKIWQGDGRDSFIVEKQKIFKIRNADKQYQINSDSRTFKFFRKIDIENKNAYTIRLTAIDN